MIHDSLRKLTRGTFPGGVELFRQMCGSVGAGRPTLTPAEAHPHITARHVPGNNLRIAYLHTQLSDVLINPRRGCSLQTFPVCHSDLLCKRALGTQKRR